MFINKNDLRLPTRLHDKSPYFECDDLIAPAILLLNNKGYKTKYCCCGHPLMRVDPHDENKIITYPGYGSEFYILFENNYEFPTPPDNGKLVPDKSGNTCIRAKLVNLGEHDAYEEIYDVYDRIYQFNKSFYEWVKTLDSLV